MLSFLLEVGTQDESGNHMVKKSESKSYWGFENYVKQRPYNQHKWSLD